MSQIKIFFSSSMMLYVDPCGWYGASGKQMNDAYYKLGHCCDFIYGYIYYYSNIIKDKIGI